MNGSTARPPSGAFFWRYFIPLAIFVVIGVALPMVFVIPGQRAFLRERARADAITTAELAGRALAGALGSGKVADLKSEMAVLRRTYPTFGLMAVTSRAGKVLAHTDASQEGKLEVDLVPPPVSAIVHSARGNDGEPRLEITLPITSGEEVRGTLRTEMRLITPVSAAWTGIGHVAALTACLLGIGCLVSLQLARWQTTGRVVVRERIVPERKEDKAPGSVTAPAQPVNELLAAMVEATPTALFVVDEVTRKILHANGAFCRLWGLEELEDKIRAATVDYDAVAAHCNAGSENVVLPVPLGATDLDPLRLIDEELRCRDGRIVRCFSLPLTLGGRHVRLYVHTDITAERRREQELIQAVTAAHTTMREKAAFSAQVSRILRAPLNGLLGTVGLLADTKLTLQQSTYVDTVRGSGEDVLGMVNNLLDLAAIDAGELNLSSSAFKLRHIIHEALAPFAMLAHRKSIDVAGSIADGVPSGFTGDGERLCQVLTNLVASAVHATEHGEVIVNVAAAPAEMSISSTGIRIATDGSRTRAQAERQAAMRVSLRFEVRDTGRSITPEEQASLFQVMGAPSADMHYRTSLPLLVARRLAELMGGTVGVESEPGRGNTLWLTLPLQVDAQAKDDIAPSVDTFNTSRILVVDDNATVRALLEQQLRAWHLTSEGAAGGDEALRLLRSAADYGTPYSLAIIDAQMPEMDGLTLADAIRREPRLAGLPLFLLTSSAQISGDTYPGIAVALSKPVHPSSLYDALVAHLGAKSGERRTVACAAVGRKGRLRGRLLLAEDNLVNQKIALRMLDKLGYQTDVVTNGNDAVEAAGRFQYDAILMDCQMPEMDGVTAATVIREQEGADRHVPIIAVTANSMDADRERCLAAGMDDFLAKPVRSAEIEAVLDRWSSATKRSDADAGPAFLRLAPSAAQSA